MSIEKKNFVITVISLHITKQLVRKDGAMELKSLIAIKKYTVGILIRTPGVNLW